MICIHGMGRPVEACEVCDLGDALDVADRKIAVFTEALEYLSRCHAGSGVQAVCLAAFATANAIK